MGKSYIKTPRVPSALLPRYRVMLEVLGGTLTVSEGARRLGLSRNHFQTLMHRGLSGLLEGLRTKPAGRPSRGTREKELLEEKARLERENSRLRRKVETTDRLLGIAKGFLRATPESRSKRTTSKARTEDG
jgi:hypothetical protein